MLHMNEIHLCKWCIVHGPCGLGFESLTFGGVVHGSGFDFWGSMVASAWV
jgi:hypothetical protein